VNKTVAEMPAKRMCRPAKLTIPCGERRKCVPDDAGTTALVQPFPAEGPLFDNLDLPKPELERLIGGLPGKVRSYKMISVCLDDTGQLEQYGSGPNFQGGILTLCTCRHEIRAEKVNPQDWRGWWFAGFTSPKSCGRLWLFYLARMEAVYASQADLWEALPAHVRQAKSTRRNRLGDVYQPNPSSPCADPWDAAHYYPPLVGHSHHLTASDDNWKKDIEFYHSNFKRRAPYLVAKPELTFLWQTPMLYLDEHPRNLTRDNVKALLSRLKMA
jgi:hypothetical protein